MSDGMTDESRQDRMVQREMEMNPKKYELSLPEHKYEFDYLENIIEVMNINEPR